MKNSFWKTTYIAIFLLITQATLSGSFFFELNNCYNTNKPSTYFKNIRKHPTDSRFFSKKRVQEENNYSRKEILQVYQWLGNELLITLHTLQDKQNQPNQNLTNWDFSENMNQENREKLQGALSIFPEIEPIKNIVSFTKHLEQSEIYVAYTNKTIIKYQEDNEPKIWTQISEPIQKIFLNQNKQILFCLTANGKLYSWDTTTKKMKSIDLKINIKNALVDLDRTKIQIIDFNDQKHIWQIPKLGS